MAKNHSKLCQQGTAPLLFTALSGWSEGVTLKIIDPGKSHIITEKTKKKIADGLKKYLKKLLIFFF